MAETTEKTFDTLCRNYDSPFLASNDTANTATALVILNSPITRPPSRLFQKLWAMSSFRICADGGANRLYDATVSFSSGDASTAATQYVPNMIRGDLDSLRPDVRAYYESMGSVVEQDHCQDTNDLDKALQAVQRNVLMRENNTTPNNTFRVCIYGAFGGRFDQEMASIQALYKWSEPFHNNLTLYSDETCAILLPALVKNEIRLPLSNADLSSSSSYGDTSERIGREGPTCGLIPIGGRCESVRTTGLKWNLDGTTPLEFGGLVSSSNHVTEELVTIQTSHPLVFTTEMI
jgi:thiamine pyrophosphokinase